MELMLHGKPLVVVESARARISAYLDALADGVLVSTNDLMEELSSPFSTIAVRARDMDDYTAKLTPRDRVWGNPRTIAELKRRQSKKCKS